MGPGQSGTFVLQTVIGVDQPGTVVDQRDGNRGAQQDPIGLGAGR